GAQERVCFEPCESLAQGFSPLPCLELAIACLELPLLGLECAIVRQALAIACLELPLLGQALAVAHLELPALGLECAIMCQGLAVARLELARLRLELAVVRLVEPGLHLLPPGRRQPDLPQGGIEIRLSLVSSPLGLDEPIVRLADSRL